MTFLDYALAGANVNVFTDSLFDLFCLPLAVSTPPHAIILIKENCILLGRIQHSLIAISSVVFANQADSPCAEVATLLTEQWHTVAIVLSQASLSTSVAMINQVVPVWAYAINEPGVALMTSPGIVPKVKQLLS